MANHHQRKSAKAIIPNRFRPDTPQGRFISWLAGKVAEQLASQDLHLTVTSDLKKKAVSKRILQDDKQQCWLDQH
jgi:hypothetical protein